MVETGLSRNVFARPETANDDLESIRADSEGIERKNRITGAPMA